MRPISHFLSIINSPPKRNFLRHFVERDDDCLAPRSRLFDESVGNAFRYFRF